LLDKVGAEAFSDEDERLASILAAQVGRIYENSSLYADLQQRAADLEREVIERRKAEEEASRLASIIKSSDQAVLSRTLDGVILTWNPAAEQLYGYTAAEALGGNISLIIPPDRLTEEVGIVERLRQGGGTEYVDTVRGKKDGRLIHISAALSSLKDKTGKVIGVSEIARDITERQSFDEAYLRLEEKEKGRRRVWTRLDLLFILILGVLVFAASFQFNLFEVVVRSVLPYTTRCSMNWSSW